MDLSPLLAPAFSSNTPKFLREMRTLTPPNLMIGQDGGYVAKRVHGEVNAKASVGG